MSSFVVSNETAFAVAQGLAQYLNCEPTKHITARFVKELLNLNIQQTCRRYKEEPQGLSNEEAWAIVSEFYDNDKPRYSVDDEQIIGSAQCWQYQCLESADIEENPLYMMVSNVINYIKGLNDWKSGAEMWGSGHIYAETYYAPSFYDCGKERVKQYDQPIEFPWGIYAKDLKKAV